MRLNANRPSFLLVMMYLCTCSICVAQTCIDKDGNEQYRQFVSCQLQLKHYRADVQDPSPHGSTREATPEPKTLRDDHDNQDETLNATFEALQLDGRDPSMTGKFSHGLQ